MNQEIAKLRMLVLTSSYPPVVGGVQTVSHVIARHLVSKGHRVQVITNCYPRTLPRVEVIDEVAICRTLFLTPSLAQIRNRRPQMYVASLYYFPMTLGLIRHTFLSLKPQIVHVHFPDAVNPFVLWLKDRYAFRLVVSLHGDDVLGFKRRTSTEQARFRLVLEAADSITACSSYLLDEALAIVPTIQGKSQVVYNGIDLSRFASPISSAPPARRYILSFGRLTYQKGYDLLIEAFSKVAARFGNIDLILAGGGEERTSLEDQVERSNLRGRVTFFGVATPPQIVQLLAACEFVVFPRRSEPFGIVALEAMAAGKAVLATRVGGLPEFLTTPPNRLVEPSAEALSEALQEWLSQLEVVKDQGQQNRSLVEPFSWQQVLYRFDSILLNTDLHS